MHKQCADICTSSVQIYEKITTRAALKSIPKTTYLICRLMISLPASSMTWVQFFAYWILPWNVKRQENFENAWEETIWNTYGAAVGVVTDIATLIQIGSNASILVLGTTSNHFSIVSCEAGQVKSSKERAVEPITSTDFEIGKPWDDGDMSSNRRWPQGSHWK